MEFYSDHIEQDEQALRQIREAMNYCLSVCINDTTDNRTDLQAWHTRYHQLMGEIFKNPSSYERAAPVPEKTKNESISLG